MEEAAVSSGLSDACNMDHWVTHEQRCCIQRRRLSMLIHFFFFFMVVLKCQSGIIHDLSQIWQHRRFLHFKAKVVLWIHSSTDFFFSQYFCNVLLSLSALGIKTWNWTTLIRTICWGTNKATIYLRYYIKLSFSPKASVVTVNVFGFRKFPMHWYQFISLQTPVGNLSWTRVIYLQIIDGYSQ